MVDGRAFRGGRAAVCCGDEVSYSGTFYDPSLPHPRFAMHPPAPAQVNRITHLSSQPLFGSPIPLCEGNRTPPRLPA